MGGEKPPSGGQEGETEREREARLKIIREFSEDLDNNEEIKTLTASFKESLAKLETYLQRPAIGSVTAKKLHNQAVDILEVLKKKRLVSRSTFAYDPEFDSFVARLEDLRVKIEALP
jgi:hypothetical protein